MKLAYRELLWKFVVPFLVIWMLMFMVRGAFAHSEAIVECSNNIPYKSAVKTNEFKMQNGLLDEHYDTNNDGVADVHVLSSITSPGLDDEGLVPHRANPTFWAVDYPDYDGNVDQIYIDVRGEGNCDDIKLYQDYREPLPDNPGGKDPIEKKRKTT